MRDEPHMYVWMTIGWTSCHEASADQRTRGRAGIIGRVGMAVGDAGINIRSSQLGDRRAAVPV